MAARSDGRLPFVKARGYGVHAELPHDRPRKKSAHRPGLRCSGRRGGTITAVITDLLTTGLKRCGLPTSWLGTHLGHSAERMKDHYDMRVKPSVFKRNTWMFYYNPRRYVGKSPKWQRFYTQAHFSSYECSVELMRCCSNPSVVDRSWLMSSS